jgi:hypothetical protein
MSELERQAAAASLPTVVNPATGEIVLLEGPTDALAAEIAEARELRSRLDAFVSDLSAELLRRMDHEATYTARVGGWTVKGDAPLSPDYDGRRLFHELSELERAGVIGERAREGAVERAEEFKAKKRGINALLKSPDERVQAALARARKEPTKSRRVTVTRG